MTELGDLVASDGPSDLVAFRRGRVLSVSGRQVTVDLGTLQVTVPAADSCYPIPGQTVLLAVEGSTMTAIASIGGVNKQPTLKVTGSTETTITGVVNGVPRQVTKAGTFNAALNDELPLYWAADGSEVWAGGKAGVPYVPPPPVEGGGGGGGGGGTPTSYTSTYAANLSGYTSISSGAQFYGPLYLEGGVGWYNYGKGRFRELASRTILSARINVPRQSGTGSVQVAVVNDFVALPGESTIGTGGWVNLPLARVSQLIAAGGHVRLYFRGSGVLSGIPAGAVQITWR